MKLSTFMVGSLIISVGLTIWATLWYGTDAGQAVGWVCSFGIFVLGFPALEKGWLE